jgi:ABC-2 type transport system ATP-binding protein
MKALTIENLVKRYSNGLEALKGIDLRVEEGDFYALLGPNGAGKSTTIGILSSLIRKTSGKVKIFDIDIDQNFLLAKTLIGLVPQEINFSQFETCLEITMNQAGYYGIPRRKAAEQAEKYLTQLDLWDRRNDRSRLLSGGMKRRLMIARALLHEPPLLILDEPTAGVDIELRRSMWKFLVDINRAGTTIILTTHYLEEAENLCRDIAIIDHGEIIADRSMKSLLSELNTETFVLDLQTKISEDFQLPGFPIVRIDENTVEVEVAQQQSLNAVFSALSQAGIQVASMKNKANRLEETFLRLVGPTKGNP